MTQDRPRDERGRFLPTYLQPRIPAATFLPLPQTLDAEPLTMCGACGALVGDRIVHTEFHDLLRRQKR